MKNNHLNVIWDERHSKIFNNLISLLNKDNIKFFILRNYEGLPEYNSSKDIDIIVDPTKIDIAIDLLKKVYRQNNLKYFYYVKYEKGHNCKGINPKLNIAIHIDLMEGYLSRGSEIFDFNELYDNTNPYKNFKVLNEFYNGLMLFIYKQFGYKKPKLKKEYCDIIYETYIKYPEFQNQLIKLIGKELTKKIVSCIEKKDYIKMLSYTNQLTSKLNIYAFKNKPIETLFNKSKFYIEKINRVIINSNKYTKFISVMAPDGAGKTTMLENLLDKIAFYWVDDSVDNRCSLYHFRPTILPNLGAVGEKAKVMKQDTDYSNPHRAKPANKLSSLIRITYYTTDYILGYFMIIKKDVKVDKFTIFDRYSYDFLIDPLRSRINLPIWVRKLYVKLTPQPKIVFYLHADPDVIFKRKQELTLEEITRQNKIYLDLANSHDRFKILDANRHYDESVDEALEIILDTFCEKL